MMNGMPAMGPLMWLFMLLFWGLAILGLVAVVRWIVGRGKTTRNEASNPQSALEILKSRFARGEISREEFERMKKELLE